MKAIAELTDAHVVLCAVQAASEGDLDTLLKIVRWRPDVLSNTLTYRLLLSFYPTETTEPSAFSTFLQSLADPSNSVASHGSPNLDPSIAGLSRNEAIRRCRAISLRSIPQHTSVHGQSALADFIVEWAKRLEQLNGAAQPSVEFVEQFVEQDTDLRLWYETYLLPVYRLQYEFYPEVQDVIALENIERISGLGAIRTLLQYAERQHNPTSLARDLEQVVSPWVRGAGRAKRRKVGHSSEPDVEDEVSWESVYDWLMSSSMTDFSVSAKAYVEWNGPGKSPSSTDEDAVRYAQAGLAMIYACSETSTDAQSICIQVLRKAVTLVNLKPPDLSEPEPEVSLPASISSGLDETDLLPNSLRRRTNGLTNVNKSSVQLMIGLLATAKVLRGFGLPWTVRDMARACIFGSERRHKDELRRLLQHISYQTRKEIDWQSIRQQILWLQSWSHREANHERPAFLSRLSLAYVDTQILDAYLKAGQYGIVKEVYLSNSSSPLPSSQVEARVVAAILDAYDNASNGNRDRGGVKRSNEILKAFRPDFPESSTLSDIDYLIRATHSLSFYQLTLQHGVPFKPVAIRVQKDPLTFLEKVVEQDSRAYTKLDDLLEIGRNLVRAHLPNRGNIADASEPMELRLMDAEHRVTYLAIMAALAANDFDTAYAYITTRLHTTTEQSGTAALTDDTSWRAAYAAGRYRPGASPKNLNARIDGLAQRMELLSRALMLAPSGEALAAILATWRRYEEELDSLKAQAVQEERAFEAQADGSLPGAFGLEDRDADVAETKRAMARRTGPVGSGPSYEEEAPLGLFDFARGAASALRKSAAFPLGSTGLQDLRVHSGTAIPQDAQREQASSPTSDDGGRVRKRDMVANMVGSGLGWMLGAQAQDRMDYRY